MENNFYLDMEFHEYQKRQSLFGISFGQGVDTIELISIALVNDFGRHYYAICKEFDLDAAWSNLWLRENVLNKMYDELYADKRLLNPNDKLSYGFKKESLRLLIEQFGKTKSEIELGIRRFIFEPILRKYDDGFSFSDEILDFIFSETKETINFYGYVSAYDWVLFCKLFGGLKNLPKPFPKACNDLYLMMKEYGLDKTWQQQVFPKPTNKHSALVDAIWTKELHSKNFTN